MDPMPETEQHVGFAPPQSAPAPSAIYPGDYEIILKDHTEDKFYLNKVKQSGEKYLYRGYWSSQWAKGLIEPVALTYVASTTAMSITALYRGNEILSYTLTQSSSNNNAYIGGWGYAFKDYDHYRNKVYSAYVTVEKGWLPVVSGGVNYYKYNTP